MLVVRFVSHKEMNWAQGDLILVVRETRFKLPWLSSDARGPLHSQAGCYSDSSLCALQTALFVFERMFISSGLINGEKNQTPQFSFFLSFFFLLTFYHLKTVS